jgi:signal transduction histidine kinase
MAARRTKKISSPRTEAVSSPPRAAEAAASAGKLEQPAVQTGDTPAKSARRAPTLPIWRALPRTFQGRLSLAFVMVFALAVGMVSTMTVLVLDNDLRQQEETNLQARAKAIAAVVQVKAEAAAAQDPANSTVVSASDNLNQFVRAAISDPTTLTDYANNVAQSDLRLRFGLGSDIATGIAFYPAVEPSTFSATLTAAPGRGQARDSVSFTDVFRFVDLHGVKPIWYLEVSLSAPYTTRASTIASIVGFLLLTSLAALLLAIVASSVLARRFTKPLRRLTEAARAMAEGDLARRVPAERAISGGMEITELSHQFNAMADQVEETMEVIRRDRDISREFLADVSHELRTPLAALRTFNELLQEKAGNDVAARTEFLEASAQQIERLDWLAQNLLELSKLDSGLVRLDLRPDDLRATILSAVEQAQVTALRRGIALTTELPETPLVTRHDPQRLGQVLINLIGNALKFTPRGGTVVVTLTPHKRGGRIQVSDTGVGIDANELPHVFERFYRGSRANEARGSGSGLGLAIVRSIVEMHGGRVMVESRVGTGSTFTVTLPSDPRAGGDAAATGPASPTGSAGAAKASVGVVVGVVGDAAGAAAGTGIATGATGAETPTVAATGAAAAAGASGAAQATGGAANAAGSVANNAARPAR